ncbi:RagB/SusD family nutrient uptake outer membrane protein [uncultured Flavobacterium sp.]|uniref:RagB/SusD family nutrient uptake outer membrane protein n=1 Tax=uncultured Flavobacterium sp. TaxID=165435 RepID=UPI0025E9EB3A|nr:RagB/SusD family nutrient uptake outer membrane protein [uncultured Flavobacterium sp.]
MKNIKVFYCIIIIACLTACEDFVEVGLPDSQLTGTAVFNDRNTANAALANTYAKLRDTGLLSGFAFGSPIALGLYTDELNYYGGSGVNSEILYNNALLPTSSIALQDWNDSYHQIYCANAIIEGVERSSALSQADRDQFTGEALFIRALVHFYLVNVYGAIPYIETTDHTVNRVASRMPEADVYGKIVHDLEASLVLLPDQYSDVERVRPVKATAYALLARTYLYMGLWAEASNAASAVLNDTAYMLENDLDLVFRKESTSTIWQLRPGTIGGNTYEASAFIFLAGPPPSLALDPSFVESFVESDLRASHWVGVVTDGTDTWYYPNKYKLNMNTGASGEYSIIFRIEEQYLIRAEARARQGELIGAVEDLNKVRNRAGLPDTTAISGDEIVAAVLHERRFELFTEYGHRFFDLKRTLQLDTALSGKPGWNSSDRLWPLPESEMAANPNLNPQNPGY